MDFFKYYFDYFSLTRDMNTHFFEIGLSPYESSVFKETQIFGNKKHKIYIIDQFNGKRPILWNYEFYANQNLKFFFSPTIIMDSHIAYYLHQYVTNRENLKKKPSYL